MLGDTPVRRVYVVWYGSPERRVPALCDSPGKRRDPRYVTVL